MAGQRLPPLLGPHLGQRRGRAVRQVEHQSPARAGWWGVPRRRPASPRRRPARPSACGQVELMEGSPFGAEQRGPAHHHPPRRDRYAVRLPAPSFHRASAPPPRPVDVADHLLAGDPAAGAAGSGSRRQAAGGCRSSSRTQPKHSAPGIVGNDLRGIEAAPMIKLTDCRRHEMRCTRIRFEPGRRPTSLFELPVALHRDDQRRRVAVHDQLRALPDLAFRDRVEDRSSAARQSP